MRIGIDLGGTKTEVIALADDGHELFRQRQPTPRNDYRATLQGIASLVAAAEQHCGQSGSVGIGIPGTVSTLTGRVKNANSTWLNGQPLHEDLQQLLARPVALANDANCLAISEATDGAGAGASVVFAVIIGTGCGGGIALNGGVNSGGNGLAGEWGHNPLPWPDEEEQAFARAVPCYCGKTGCNELFISGTGFETSWQRLGQPPLKGSEIMARLAQGDALAGKVLAQYQQRLAKALATVVNLLDPDVIVLGGGMSNVQSLYQTLPDLIRQWAFGGEFDTPIRPAQHGDSSGVRGAAWLPALKR